ncbi:MAG: efflux RND transporter periplasmic adaptor subunit [Verrucomicrobiales bacterium]|nr:efflux RND transporter periplasmic adaptor subunit [Verrucomicrobiales bacterium]
MITPASILRLSLLLAWAVPEAAVKAQDVASEVLTFLEPYRSIEISAIESGTIQSILVEEGAEVVAQAELIRLDTRVLEARLAVIKTQADGKGRLEAAEAERSLNADRLAKINQLEQRGTANNAEKERSVTTLKISEGNLLAAKEDIQIFGLQAAEIEAEIERRILRSPIKGTVVEITKDVAEPVGYTNASLDSYLVRVVELDRLKALVHAPFEQVRPLKVGDRLRARLQDGLNTEAVGVVELISPIVDPATGTKEVRLVFDNADRHLVSGVNALILFGPPPAGSGQ